MQIADFDGDGLLDIAFAEQEQSAQKRIGIFFNQDSGATWALQVLAVTGGHNLKAGLIGNDRYPSLLCANHGYYGAPDAGRVVAQSNAGFGTSASATAYTAFALPLDHRFLPGPQGRFQMSSPL